MRKRFVDRLHELRATQHGFTLLELLIGVVIVSILAAVATQYFLHQRRKGWVAQVRASTRHMAGAQNYFVFDGGASGFTNDLDDLYLIGYRWDDLSVRPYVALATNQTYCVQVHSAHDPSIVWHFSSNTGYPQEGPATPNDCGDPEVLGTYIAGLPPASAGRDGVPSGPGDGSTVASTDGSGNTGSDTPPGGGSTGGGTTSDPGTDTPPSTGSTGTGGTGGAPDPGGTGGATDPGSGGTGGTGGTGGSGGTTDPGSGGSGGTSASGGSGGTSGSSGSSGSGGSNGGSHGGGGCKKDDKNDPDGDENGGHDAPGGSGGTSGSQDCNNGSGNDADGEDDNNGGGKGGK